MGRHHNGRGRGCGRGRSGRGYGKRWVAPKEVEPHCSVCTTGPPKYKCPKCRAIYCSIACCRRHKEELCGKEGLSTVGKGAMSTASAAQDVSQQQEIPSSTYVQPPAALQELLQQTTGQSQQSHRQQTSGTNEFADLAPNWQLTQDMKDAVDRSAWLASELTDPGLRALLTRIVHTPYETAVTMRRGDTMSAVAKSQREIVLEELRAKHPAFAQFVDKSLVLAGVLERSHEVDAVVPIETWLASTSVPQGLVMKDGDK